MWARSRRRPDKEAISRGVQQPRTATLVHTGRRGRANRDKRPAETASRAALAGSYGSEGCEHSHGSQLFAWLTERFGIDLSLYGEEEEEREVRELFASLKDTVDSARNFGVRHNGIALLVAYCFEGLQQLHFRQQDRGEPPGAVARPTSREARVSCAASRPGSLGRYHPGAQQRLRDAPAVT
jgi:hypothetical protein